MMMIESHRVNAPEAVSITYDVAGIGSRFLAAVIDTLLMLVAIIVIIIGTVALARVSPLTFDAASILDLTLTFLLIFCYYIVFEALWSGRTPGKRLVKLRVLKTSGYPIGFVDSAIRNLVRIADFLPVLYGFGVLVMFISPESRRLGDYAAGTVVVRERPPVKLADLSPIAPSVSVIPRGSVDPEEMQWDLDAITADDLRLVTELLTRLPTLRPEAGRNLATQIADRLAARITARQTGDAAQFLRRLVELCETEQSEWSTR